MNQQPNPQSELIKRAGHALRIAVENAQTKEGFVPMGADKQAQGGMPPPGGAMPPPPGGMPPPPPGGMPPPMDPSMGGGMPPPPPGGMPPMDPAMGGMPPPMDPAMGGMPPVDPATGMPMDPAAAGGAPPPEGGGGQPIVVGLEELVQLFEEISQGQSAGAPNETDSPKKMKLEEEIGSLNAKFDQLLQMLGGGAPPGGGEMPPEMGGMPPEAMGGGEQIPPELMAAMQGGGAMPGMDPAAMGGGAMGPMGAPMDPAMAGGMEPPMAGGPGVGDMGGMMAQAAAMSEDGMNKQGGVGSVSSIAQTIAALTAK